MNRRQIYAVIVSFFALVALVNVANAQSTNKANSTRLISNEISSPIYDDSRNGSVYYSFEAGPGEVTMTLNVETAGRAGDGKVNEVEVDLSSETGAYIASVRALAVKLPTQSKEAAKQQVERITLSRRQKVLMRIFFTGENMTGGKYQLILNGAVKFEGYPSNWRHFERWYGTCGK